ncbi:hypothetical protein DPMN_046714 [Dreissena polymorpha]|uniref:PHD-type domain-containing protein n=1 Tax=Dreissena polymorpha TaxID=45954 RepID=A0A9D4I0T3_DREPO|nr:hypothetical protein DPMN_046714 [Dreissena polymorpha]
MLTWFVDESISTECVSGDRLVRETDITVTADTVHLAASEQNLDIVKCHFEQASWDHVTTIIEKAKTRHWTCKVCVEALETRCVCCDLCLSWLHYHCAALSAVPKKKFWFCVDCAIF